MKVRDVMTTEVATVHPTTSLKYVARLLGRLGISGVPVVDGGVVVGVVSEADVLVKERGLVDRSGSFLRRSAAPGVDAKIEALTAGEAMTSPPVVIGPERPVRAAARTMLDRRISRLPVVDDGRLVGIVTRADLVRAFTRADAALEREIRHDVMQRSMWIQPDLVEVSVVDGAVTLAGVVDTKTDAEVLERLVRHVPGVVSVEAKLQWRLRDRDLTPVH